MTSYGRQFRTIFQACVMALMLIGISGGWAFAEVEQRINTQKAVTAEHRDKARKVEKQMDQKISNTERQSAADSLKALRQQIHDYATQKYNGVDPNLEAKKQHGNKNKKNPDSKASYRTLGLEGFEFLAPPTGPRTYGPNTVPDYNTTANWAFTPPIAKFVDTLPQLCVSTDGYANENNLHQCLPVAVADTTTYPGSDYYEIWLEEWDQPMHSDMPATRVRGYVQKQSGTPTSTAANDTASDAAPRNYLAPIIVAERDRPVRVKFVNKLLVGQDGDLFIPVDQSVMGAGQGPLNADGTPCDNTLEGNTCAFYPQNRATVHLHGGRTPWISDGTPHQWITPAAENTPYPKGVSVANVPDMEDPGDGSMTFYYSNQQTARLMFYHDHAFGITRLNVLVGEAAGYVITDKYEQDLITRQILPDIGIPLIIQDRTFVDATPLPNPRNGDSIDPLIRHTDPLWNWGTGALDPVTGVRAPETGDFWLPHVYMPAQNPSNLELGGVNPFGRWMYGPWFYPATVITYPPIANPYHDPDCESSNPLILADCATPGQPSLIPATPHPSMGMEAFFDSIVVNGTAFPRLNVEPKAYRFRILNAGNDRAMNLSIYKADATPANLSQALDATTGKTKFSGMTPAPGFDPQTEVKMVDAVVTPGWPELWPVDGRPEGVPDPGTPLANGRWSNWGPSFIQIGTDAGFLPAPAIREPQPVTYVTDPTAFWVGIVKDTGLALMPAERADVIVDFSEYAGETLILYNDAPAAWPAGVTNYDY
ncbi:MAG: hypothetical protein GW875_14385, partial [Deltaproteobacteria bacterium]|nr:hypothetical protein [Deltaproteobacteria bacterium]